MNRKQFLMLVVLGFVVGGAGLYYYKRNASDWQSSGGQLGQKLAPTLAVNDVSHLTIKQDASELNLYKKDGRWVVKERNNYPANFSEISDFVRKTADLKATQTIKAGPSQRPRLQLTEPGSGTNSGTLVEFKNDSGKALQRLLLGKKHVRKSSSPSPMGGMGMGGDDGGFPDGRYILNLDGSKDSVAVVSDPLSQVEPKAEQWLDKEFFKIEKPKSIELVSTNATNSWKITRETETAEWVLADVKGEEKLDAGKVSGLSTAFASPSFSDVAVSPKPEETGLGAPTTVKIATFDGLAYTLDVGKKSGEDNYFLAVKVAGDLPKERTPGKEEKAEDKDKLDKEWKEKSAKLEEKLKQEKTFENWVYLTPRWTVDNALKDRAQLMVEKKEEPKTEGLPGNPASPTIPGLPPGIELPKPENN